MRRPFSRDPGMFIQYCLPESEEMFRGIGEYTCEMK